MRSTFLAIALGVTVALAACSTSSGTENKPDGPLDVVAAENTWGDIATQIGGTHAHVESLISGTNVDPHDYEPSAEDATRIARADLLIVNGIGYDLWATKVASANKIGGSKLLSVGDVTGHKVGDNPHRWYSPSDVKAVIDALVARFSEVDPSHAADYAANAKTYRDGAFAKYTKAVAELASYKNVPIGASESVIAPLVDDVGLDLLTPESFIEAVSEGAEPTIADKKTAEQQIRKRLIKAYVYNSQNATPDVAAQVALAKANSIPVVTVTETPNPAGASFVDWQVAQITALVAALAESK